MSREMKRLKAEETIDYIVEWLRSYATKSGMNGFVIGISGGVDSALTSSLCAKTGLPTLCVSMPIHQAASQVNRALEHIENLKRSFPNTLSHQEVDLSASFELLLSAFPKGGHLEQTEMAKVNTRARLRMTSLYFLAAAEKRLVAGTGNKIEDFGVGFYTKYGDGGVDLSPIADLTKTEVFQLAAQIGVPPSILSAAPTDGLWGDDRTDEDQIGASYPELEWAMERQENNLGIEGLEGRQKEVMEIYLRLNRANQHKIQPIPVCILPTHLRA
jgi:NAD+ synthase